MSGATNTGVLEVKSIAASDDLTGAFEEFMTTFDVPIRETQVSRMIPHVNQRFRSNPVTA